VTVVGAGRALLEARGGRSGSLALLYSCAVLVSAAIDYSSLGYELESVPRGEPLLRRTLHSQR
jgi:hypothetical protein